MLLDIKPWDDETDMVALEKAVRAVDVEGLTWGACKLLKLSCLYHCCKRSLHLKPYFQR